MILREERDSVCVRGVFIDPRRLVGDMLGVGEVLAVAGSVDMEMTVFQRGLARRDPPGERKMGWSRVR